MTALPPDPAALARALDQLADAGGSLPHMPYPVLAALRRLVRLPVIELCIEDLDGALLLTWRDDAHWRGWHFPGGFMGVDEDVATACRRIARRELGADFRLIGVAGVESWPAHPYAAPLALLCRGVLATPAADGQYFAAPPDDLLAEQRSYFAAMAGGEAIVPDRMGKGEG